ncbi:uncharacterized protein LOC110982823 isoform X1 [Acanthaster planci]|nr:uncharacterized protein LOC110982823 isoform X1 [Acanthaster planci]XP_022097211.1 uncharacterized protein LOC110982823 isoform X1 [Acanthaster planci]XP_022097212.1 uncharacterized protein LOC110982823 isoform X1 [Acanthaster planci]
MDIRYGITVFILTASLQLTLGQDLTGCGTTKGCYKKPSDCTGDDCTAYVTWENVSDGNTRFAMRAAHTPNLAWVAVGLRPQNQPSGMVPADVYVCTRTGTAIERTENIVTAQNRWDSVARVIPAGAVTNESINFADSAITCTFTRNASVAGDGTFFDISGNNAYYLLLAVGNDLNGDGSISGTYHASRWSTPIALKLQSEFEVSPEPELVGCGTTRGCYRQPSTCSGEDCTVFVTWENVTGGQTRFTMRASRAQNLAWVAVGLRPETQSSGMVPADVYVCTSNGTAVERTENVLTAQNRWNSETRAIPAGSVTTQFIQFEDNAIACVFTRSASMAGDSTFFDISGDNAYYLLLAVGDKLNGDGTIDGTNHADRWSTPAAMKLQSEFAIPTQPPATVPPGEDLQGCGDTRGCFRQPSDCSGDNCLAYVTWQALQDGQIRFTMRGQAQSWVAVGLRPSSVEDGMSPADVYACTQNREVKRSENVTPYDSPSREIPPNTVTEQAVTIENNAIRCMFTRQASLEGDSTFYNVSGDNRYFLLLATGNSINNDGTIAGHQHQQRWPSTETFKLTEFGEATGETRIIALAKAHASLMMIAWIGFASIGITLARFFKPMWPESKLLGQKVWFTIHRICMVICVVCFVVAFILIFVFVKGFVGGGGTAVAHAICGIIVTCLGIINPIMAVFRPHPGTPKRPIFNWAHWAVGTSAHVLAVVTIFLGIGYQTSLLTGLASYSFFVMLAFTIFHIAMWIAFEVQSRVAESQVVKPAPSHPPDVQPNSDEPGRSNDVPLKTTGGDSSHQLASTGSEPPADELTELQAERMAEGECLSQITEEGAMVKIILLFTYIVGVVSFLIFLVVVVGLAGNNM